MVKMYNDIVLSNTNRITTEKKGEQE